MFVKAKKFLGQHFLKNTGIAQKIADSLDDLDFDSVFEIGPGTGALTQWILVKKNLPSFKTFEVDEESIEFLNQKYPDLSVENQDFLEIDLSKFKNLGLIGNLPYNISSLILFKVFENKDAVRQAVFMLQKEVAERVCAKPATKSNGILSVFLQTYFDTQYLFTVGREEFIPPPKVLSAIVRLTRNQRKDIPCNADLFIKVVKTAFHQRRKTLRNALSQMFDLRKDGFEKFSSLRAEQLNVEAFFELTDLIESVTKTSHETPKLFSL